MKIKVIQPDGTPGDFFAIEPDQAPGKFYAKVHAASLAEGYPGKEIALFSECGSFHARIVFREIRQIAYGLFTIYASSPDDLRRVRIDRAIDRLTAALGLGSLPAVVRSRVAGIIGDV